MTKRERLDKTARKMRERNTGSQQGNPIVYETVQQIAKEWNVSDETVRRIFGNRNDVLKITKPFDSKKVRRVFLRIPVSTKNLVAYEMSKTQRVDDNTG